MRWFLLLVTSSIRGEENLQLLPRAPPLTHPPTCDVFLAPSTIPGSACMDIRKQNQSHFTCSVYCYCSNIVCLDCLVASVILVCSRICEQCTYLALAYCFKPSRLRLDSKQLVSEFLQDALSTKMKY